MRLLRRQRLGRIPLCLGVDIAETRMVTGLARADTPAAHVHVTREACDAHILTRASARNILTRASTPIRPSRPRHACFYARFYVYPSQKEEKRGRRWEIEVLA